MSRVRHIADSRSVDARDDVPFAEPRSLRFAGCRDVDDDHFETGGSGPLSESYRDVRFMHLEKIFTLLRWRTAHRVARALGIDRIVFPIYAYPSRIVVAERS